MRIRGCAAAIVAVVALTGSVATSAAAAPGTDRGAVRQAMQEVIAAGATGVQIRIHDESGDWTSSAGVAERGRTEGVPTDGRFRVGSITKTFIATVVLQLVAEGRFQLDDPVHRYLPEFGLDPRITVRMILQHTSGLRTHTTELNPDGSYEPGLVDDLERTYLPADTVRFVAAKPLKFEPGTSWAYSNTNYVLAGLLIERLTGTPYAWQVYLRIVAPLGMWRTELPGTGREILGPHAHGYLASPGEDATLVDVTRLNPSFVSASGEIISTTQDLDVFLAALQGGRLLPPALVAAMRDFHPVESIVGYGLGMAQYAFRPECVAQGHDGRMPGYTSKMYGTDDGRARVTVSVTEGAPDPLSGAFAVAVMRLLFTALCGPAGSGMPAVGTWWPIG
ncbi:serine hydrolase domain-containing protein [Nocardia sp. NPDC050793]|uniref:serine hydrolase domain-containing protein n=1 Tax=Nocardia sp. NPDC050793 TaxID=3155159 RepID=UPI00340FB2C2